MADLSRFLASGEALKLVGFNAGRIASGTTGDVINVTAGAGQYLKLTMLAAVTAAESGVTLVVEDTAITEFNRLETYSSTRSTIANNAGNFCVASYGNAETSRGARSLPYILCKSFRLNKNSGGLAGDVDYAYEILEKI